MKPNLSALQISELIDELESQVNNGGFDQFFFNSSGCNVLLIIEALEAVSASKTAAIVRRAASKFPSGTPPQDRTLRQEQLRQISPDCDAFEVEDKEFFAYVEDISALVSSYVSTHRDQPFRP